jgi:AcrR family transcriptional regulator
MTFSTTVRRPGPSAAPAPGGALADDRPARLVHAARALANETGSAAFTVSQVTARAGLSLKSFYRCFRSKDELLLALLAEDSRIGADLLAQRIGEHEGDEALRAFVVELFDLLALPGAAGYAGVLVREYLRLAEHHDVELRAALAPLLELLGRQLHTTQPGRDATTMFGVLLGGIHDVVVGRITDTHELGTYLWRFCTNGVGG